MLNLAVSWVVLLVLVLVPIFFFGVPLWAPSSGFMEMDNCISTPIARALSLPWNVGRCSVLLETGLLPSEILWEYICLKVCARILSNEDNPARC